MAGVRLIWDLDAAWAASPATGPDPVAVRAAGYDEQIVERQAVTGGPWTELSRATTRPPLPTSHTLYVYSDAASAHAYRVRFRRSSDGAIHATPLTSVTKTIAGYCTIADVRAEGFTIAAWPDAQVQAGIDMATAMIDRICGQWFEPRYVRQIVSGRGHDRLWFDVAICTAMKVTIDDAIMDDPATDLEIPNRHLTRGQMDPDDRQAPEIAWVTDYYDSSDRAWGAGRFLERHRNVEILGVFGCTELLPGEMAGEYSEQVPYSYGSTPPAIRRACVLLTIRRFMRLESTGDALGSYLAGRVQGESTRDQSYSLGAPTGQDGAYGMTGDLEVDNLLMLYPRPLRMGVI
jgi:hypothetical protein